MWWMISLGAAVYLWIGLVFIEATDIDDVSVALVWPLCFLVWSALEVGGMIRRFFA